MTSLLLCPQNHLDAQCISEHRMINVSCKEVYDQLVIYVSEE